MFFSNRKKIFLHIGMPKTGTSSIQRRIFNNPVRFEEASGAIYPSSCVAHTTAERGHHNLPRQLAGLPSFNTTDGDLSAILNEIARSRLGKVLVSTEGLWELAASDFLKFQLLVEKLGRLGSVRIVLFLRTEADFLESVYLQGLRGLHVKADIDDHIANTSVRLRHRINVMSQLASLKRVQLVVCAHEPGRDSLLTLLKVIEPTFAGDFPTPKGRQVNARWGIDIYRALYERYLEEPDIYTSENSALVNYRAYLKQNIEHGDYKYSILKPEQVTLINSIAQNAYKDSNLRKVTGFERFLESTSWEGHGRHRFASLDPSKISDQNREVIRRFAVDA